MALIINNITIPTTGNYVKVNNVDIKKVDVMKNGITTTVWEKRSDPITYFGADIPSRRIENTIASSLGNASTDADNWSSGGHGTDEGEDGGDCYAGIYCDTMTLPEGAKTLTIHSLFKKDNGGELLFYLYTNKGTLQKTCSKIAEPGFFPLSATFNVEGCTTFSFRVRAYCSSTWFYVKFDKIVIGFE